MWSRKYLMVALVVMGIGFYPQAASHGQEDAPSPFHLLNEMGLGYIILVSIHPYEEKIAVITLHDLIVFDFNYLE